MQPALSGQHKTFSYCSEHECGRLDCTNPAAIPLGFCEAHSCQAEYCATRTEDGRNFCDKHTCDAANCVNQKWNDRSYCQQQHACHADSCQRLRADLGCSTKMCLLHSQREEQRVMIEQEERCERRRRAQREQLAADRAQPLRLATFRCGHDREYVQFSDSGLSPGLSSSSNGWIPRRRDYQARF